MWRVVLGLIAVVGLTSTASAGWRDGSVTVDGQVRGFSLFLPVFQPKNPSLIIALHGGGGSRISMEVMAELSVYAQLYGAIVALPEGTDQTPADDRVHATWNAGRCCGAARTKNVDDVAFLRALIADARRVHSVDPNRVYLMGFSNGGMMTYRAACEMAGELAAIAAVGSAGVFDSAVGVYDQCPLGAPVPTLHVHGTEDTCSPIDGGMGGECFARFLSELLGVDVPGDPASLVDKPDMAVFFPDWADMQGFERLFWNEVPGPGAACALYGQGLVVKAKSCVVRGMGHTWPGGTYGEACQFPLGAVCKAWRNVVAGSADGLFAPYSGFSASRMIFDFFRRHRR